MEAGSCEKPITTVSPPSVSFQSLALAEAYSVGEVLIPSRLLLQASASTRWNSGSEIMSWENSFWKASYALTRSSRIRVLLAKTIASLAALLHQPM